MTQHVSVKGISQKEKGEKNSLQEDEKKFLENEGRDLPPGEGWDHCFIKDWKKKKKHSERVWN